MINNLFGAFTGTGAPFAYAIVLVFCYGVAIWFERWNTFRKWTVVESDLRAHIASRNWTDALSSVDTHPVKDFIQTAQDSSMPSWDDMAIVAPMVEEQVTHRISALSMVANISTMLGLLGTV